MHRARSIRGAIVVALHLGAAAAGASEAPAGRVISLNPSLTAMLLAIDAREVLVGVDEFSARQQPSVTDLPRVGGLYDPSLERVIALAPDLVLIVPSAEQRGFRDRLAELGIPVLAVDPVSFEDVASVLEQIGARVGRSEAAEARADAMREMRARVGAAVAGEAAIPTVLVLQRDPLFVAGAGTFVDDMLRAAGARNLGAELQGGWPRVSREWLIAAAPEVLVDTSRDPENAADFWARWPSIPAVENGRVHRATGQDVTLPGPWLDRSLLNLLDLVRPGLREQLGLDAEGHAAAPSR